MSRNVPQGLSRRQTCGRRKERSPRFPAGPSSAAPLAQLRRTVAKAGKKFVEVVYPITSANLRDAPPATLAAWVQDHWCIENSLHWIRDVTYDEDHSQVRSGNAPHVMATLRTTAVSMLRLAGWDNIATALRHPARHTDQAIACALTC